MTCDAAPAAMPATPATPTGYRPESSSYASNEGAWWAVEPTADGLRVYAPRRGPLWLLAIGSAFPVLFTGGWIASLVYAANRFGGPIDRVAIAVGCLAGLFALCGIAYALVAPQSHEHAAGDLLRVERAAGVVRLRGGETLRLDAIDRIEVVRFDVPTLDASLFHVVFVLRTGEPGRYEHHRLRLTGNLPRRVVRAIGEAIGVRVERVYLGNVVAGGGR